jgi:hypothetical protein
MMVDSLLNLDVSLFRGINQGLAYPILDGPMLFASSPTPWIALACIVFAMALVKRSPRLIAICILLGLTIAASDYLCYNLF